MWGWVIGAVCFVLARSLWVRRRTFRGASVRAALLERSMSLALLTQLLGLLLTAPWSAHIFGALLNSLFGHRNIGLFVGHACCVGSIGGVVLNARARLDIPREELLGGFKQWIERPITVVMPILLAIFIQSPYTRDRWPDTFYCPDDIWLKLYWTGMPLFMSYLLVHATIALAVLYHQPRNRATAAVYIAACAMALVGCGLRVVTAWCAVDFVPWFWCCASAVMAAFAYGSTRAWRDKIKWLEGERAGL